MKEKEVKEVKVATITIPDNAPVSVDKRSKAKVITFPFNFMSDGGSGRFVIIKGVKGHWNPADDIKEVIIVFR